MKKTISGARIEMRIPDAIALLCAAFMLCVIPLAFNDAFFDINRFKVKLVIQYAPMFLAAMAASMFLDRMRKKRFADLAPAKTSLLFMAMLLAACVISCARIGFDEKSLTGSNGRYCGLYFMLSCMAAYYVISAGRFSFKLILPAIILCSAACAALGFANGIGYDPLGFYDRIKKGQESTFLSTIGNFDFYGTYLVMMFPLAGAQFVFERDQKRIVLGGVCASVIAFGIMASRTDSALVGLHMACYLLLALSGGSFNKLRKALGLWAISFLSLPVTCAFLEKSIYKPKISGLPKLLYEMHLGEGFVVLLVILIVLLILFERKGYRPPSRKLVLSAMLIAFLIAVLVFFGLMLYFSIWDTKTKLGSAASFLRFNDKWGTLRGFVYVRSLRAFSDFDWADKIFGKGMETSLSVLKPYFDDPKMLKYGVFNDPHCQPLQMLLTCGLFGMFSFVALYVSTLVTLFRHAGNDPVLCGVLCSIWSYSLILMINVTQPILIATYFSVSALGISRVCALRSAEV